jgi:hypothetical protein
LKVRARTGQCGTLCPVRSFASPKLGDWALSAAIEKQKELIEA